MKYAPRPQPITENRAEQFDDVTQVPAMEMCVCCERKRTRATGMQTAYGFMCNYCSRGQK